MGDLNRKDPDERRRPKSLCGGLDLKGLCSARLKASGT
jgi:hypothetical protein